MLKGHRLGVQNILLALDHHQLEGGVLPADVAGETGALDRRCRRRPGDRSVRRESVGRWFTGMWKKAKDVWDNITGAIRTAKDKIVGFVQAIKDKLTGIWDSLTSGLSEKTQQSRTG